MIITLAIMSILGIVISQMFSSTYRTNSSINDSAEYQADAQTVMQKIQNELKYANSITIDLNAPTGIVPGLKYLYVSVSGGIPEKNYGISLSDAVPIVSLKTGFTSALTFKKSSSKSVEIIVDIFKNGTKVYTLDTNVNLNNMISDSVSGSAQGSSIEYTLSSSLVAKALTGITIKTAPTKILYVEGQTFDPTGMVLTETYDDGSSQDVTTGYNVSPSGVLATTDSTVTVIYGGKTTTQAITVNPFEMGVRGTLAITQGVALVTAVNASGTITFDTQVSGNTVTVNGTKFTYKSNPNSNSKYKTISDLTSDINGLTNVNATYSGNAITINAVTAGTAGNNITLEKNGTGLTLSGSTLTGGVDAVTGVTETANFTVNTGAAKAGNIIVTVNGTDYTVSISSGDNASNVATKIYNTLSGHISAYIVSNPSSGVLKFTSNSTNTNVQDMTVSIK